MDGTNVCNRVDIPPGPAGDQAFWLLGFLRSLVDLSISDDHLDEEAAHVAGAHQREPALRRAALTELAERIGSASLVEAVQHGDDEVRLLIERNQSRRYWLHVTVGGQPPHLIERWGTRRALPEGMVIRNATPEDAAGLAELERRDPIVIGDTTITVDRGDDYYEFARLMEGAAFVVADHDGTIVGVMGGCTHPARIGGALYRMGYAHRLRIAPEHQGGGLWGHLADAWYGHYPLGERIDCSYGYAARGNATMQAAWATLPNKWPIGPVRVLLDCRRVATAADASPVTAAAIPSVVGILNACHDEEEVFVPYTEESLTERLTRAPDLYGIENLLVTEGAVMGVWAAGRTALTVVERAGEREEQRRAIVLDYGFLPGHAAQFEHLLSAWSDRLSKQGITHLIVYSSELSPGWDSLVALADHLEPFDYWTPQIPVAPEAGSRGLYVDAICF